MKITIDLFDTRSLNKAIRSLESYKSDFKVKADKLCMRLASMGQSIALVAYSKVEHFVTDKETAEYTITVEQKGDHFWIRASGADVLFIEFGSGSRYGWGHPDLDFAEGGHYGPGTYSPKGHWDSPKGWWTPQGQHSYGNAPTAGMWRAKEWIMDNALRIAEEIFNG